MNDVHEINCLADLAGLRSAWRGLLAQTPGYSLFHTLEWLESAWGNYARPQRLRVVVVERRGQVVGIVPFCVREEPRRVGTVRVLTYPLDDWGTFYGPLGPEPGFAFRQALHLVARTKRDWDLIDLRWVDESADEFFAIGEAFRECSFEYRVRPRMEVRHCHFGQGWEAYLKSRSRNWRRKMSHDVELLARAGDVVLRRYRPAAGCDPGCEEHAEVYRICEEISARTWQAADASQSCLSSPRVRDALFRVHCQAAALGMLDTNILEVGGKAVAFNYNYVAEGRTYGLRCGYDPSSEREGCGRVLLYMMLQDSFRRGDIEYNFGPGRQPYKDRFATGMRHAYTFRHYAKYSLRSQLLHLKESAAERLWSAAHLAERSLVE